MFNRPSYYTTFRFRPLVRLYVNRLLFLLLITGLPLVLAAFINTIWIVYAITGLLLIMVIIISATGSLIFYAGRGHPYINHVIGRFFLVKMFRILMTQLLFVKRENDAPVSSEVLEQFLLIETTFKLSPVMRGEYKQAIAGSIDITVANTKSIKKRYEIMKAILKEKLEEMSDPSDDPNYEIIVKLYHDIDIAQKNLPII